MTNQEVFNRTVLHLRQQGCKSILPGGQGCLYRGPDGTKCAAGIHITDDEYLPSMEGVSILRNLLGSPEGGASNAIFSKGIDISLMGDLQHVHDGYEPNEWDEALADVAKQYDLFYSLDHGEFYGIAMNSHQD